MKINQNKVLINESPVDLEKRLTYRYNSGWSYLDKHEYLGQAQAVAATRKKGDDDYWTNSLLLQVKDCDGVDQDDIKSALESTFSGGRCQHEHDCCGCVSTSVNSVRPMKDGHYALRMSYSRNI